MGTGNGIRDWMREGSTAAKLCYHSLGRLYFILRWAVFFFVLILFTGAWYDELFQECKNGQFSGFTMFWVVVSGIVAFADVRDKIVKKEESEDQR